jgi:hypothetical protein
MARDHETLALASTEVGAFVVEMTRVGESALGRSGAASGSAASGRDAPVSGKLTIRAFGQTQTVPFTLSGARAPVARVDARWEAELVPVEDDSVSALGVEARPFDRSAAASALARVSVAHCGASGQVGTGRAIVVFGPAGRVINAFVDDSSFAGTPAGRCVTAAFFGASMPPFSGPAVRVGKSFTIAGAGVP